MTIASDIHFLARLTTSAIAELSTTEIAGLSAAAFSGMNVRQVRALTTEQIRAISNTTLDSLTHQTFGPMTTTQLEALTTGQIASMTAATLRAFTTVNIAALSVTQIAAISPDALEALGLHKLSFLDANQVRALTSAQVDALRFGELGAIQSKMITNGAVDTLHASPSAALAELRPATVAKLTDAQVASLSVSQFDALLADKTRYLGAIGGASLADLQSLTTSQFSQLDGGVLGERGGAFLSQMNPSLLTTDQIYELAPLTISQLTSTFLNQLSSQQIEAISLDAITGLSTTQLSELNPSQIMALTPEQVAAMQPAQAAIINLVNPMLVEAVGAETNGMLSYSGALSFLENAAAGGMTSTKLTDLQAVANALQTQLDASASGNDDAIITSAAIKQLFDGVASGLSSTSTEAQVTQLIGQEFLGTALPGLQTDTAGDMVSATYQPTSTPLYGASGAPVYTDVTQGAVNDSALLASLAETALQDPSYIQSLITNNGNGTYTVEIPNYFNPLFVTVNDHVATLGNGSAVFAGDTNASWAALMEKAAAQVSSAWAPTNNDGSTSAGNEYASLAMNSDDALSQFAGQYYYPEWFGLSGSLDATYMSNAEGAFKSGFNAILEAGASVDGLTVGHYYAVTAINSAAGTISVYDPMGGSSSTVSTSGLDASHATLYYGNTQRASA